MYLDDSYINGLDIDNVKKLLLTGNISTRSNAVEEFEIKCSEYLGVDDSVATNCGTSALHLALIASDIGRGDEVILPATTFIATANVIRYVGAKPIFVDVDPNTWCIDIVSAKKALTEKTKAIISVDLYGIPCWDLEEFVTDHNLMWISDSCESLGSKDINGDMLPPMADYVCYSFNGNKIMTTGSGGLITSKYRDLRWVRSIANVGRNELGELVCGGYNYNMNGIQAALGISQLSRISELVDKKRRFNYIYRNELDSILDFQECHSRYIPNYWLTAAKHPSNLHIVMMSQGLPFRKIFPPISLCHIYGGDDFRIKEANFKNGIDLYDNGACLPSSILNTEDDVMNVCKILKGVL